MRKAGYRRDQSLWGAPAGWCYRYRCFRYCRCRCFRYCRCRCFRYCRCCRCCRWPVLPVLPVLPLPLGGGATLPPLPPVPPAARLSPFCGRASALFGFCDAASCVGCVAPLLFCGVVGTDLGATGVCGSAGLLSLPPPPQAVSAVRIAPERSSFVVFMLFTLRFIGEVA